MSVGVVAMAKSSDDAIPHFREGLNYAPWAELLLILGGGCIGAGRWDGIERPINYPQKARCCAIGWMQGPGIQWRWLIGQPIGLTVLGVLNEPNGLSGQFLQAIALLCQCCPNALDFDRNFLTSTHVDVLPMGTFHKSEATLLRGR